MNTPAGPGPAADRPVLEELDTEECLELISPGGIGRVAFDDGEGPAVIPVNYAVEGTAVIFRTSLEGRLNKSLATVLTGAAVRIAFEVDRIDEERHEGWSVLLRGGGEHLPDHERPAGASVEPWPGGDRPVYIRIEPQEISGRRLRHG
ncbi:pyridoxamine 5'-phosphate oxidase family protein [Spirillospora sp. NPDC029432]|uniref:pyridoxamine 5'-phosphate oxidase family protein n=1 Tax=Spirillospora sp. NPDC029432 TaxID=3154599 RepID=UPI0034515E6E